MVDPGRKTGSILTRAIAVDLTEFSGATIVSRSRETSKIMDFVEGRLLGKRYLRSLEINHGEELTMAGTSS
jgi:hypothetical protein